MRSPSLVAPIFTCLSLVSSIGRAEERAPIASSAREPNGALAFMAGAAAAMIPITLGAALMSSGQDQEQKNFGFALAGAGFVLAPVVSHAVLGELRRAAFFGALPALSELGMIALVAARPDGVFHGTTVSRTTFGALLCVDVASSMVGLIDAAMAGDRARGRRFILAPTVAQGAIGFAAAGTL